MFDQLSEGKSLGVFIRWATKMDKDSINDYFAEFINDANMNSMQIEFVQRLINIIVEQGEINMDALMKGRVYQMAMLQFICSGMNHTINF